MLSMHDDERYVFEALKAGASRLRAQARGRPRPRRRRARGRPRRAVPDQRRERDAVREWMARRQRRPARAADAPRAGGAEADRRGAHEPRDRRDPAPQREDRRVAPRRTSCASSACATASSSCATRSGAGSSSRRRVGSFAALGRRCAAKAPREEGPVARGRGARVANQSGSASESDGTRTGSGKRGQWAHPPSMPWPRSTDKRRRTPAGAPHAPRSASVGDIRAARPAG